MGRKWKGKKERRQRWKVEEERGSSEAWRQWTVQTFTRCSINAMTMRVSWSRSPRHRYRFDVIFMGICARYDETVHRLGILFSIDRSSHSCFTIASLSLIPRSFSRKQWKLSWLFYDLQELFHARPSEQWIFLSSLCSLDPGHAFVRFASWVGRNENWLLD